MGRKEMRESTLSFSARSELPKVITAAKGFLNSPYEIILFLEIPGRRVLMVG